MKPNKSNRPYDQERDTATRRVARNIGKIAAIGLASTAATLGAGQVLGYAIDNSPTTKLQRSYEEQEHKAEEARNATLSELQQQENVDQVSQQELEQFKREFPDDPNIHVR